MKLAAAVALALVLGLVPAAARPSDPVPDAVAIARLVLPEANWNQMIADTSEQVRGMLESQFQSSGMCVAEGFADRLREEYLAAMPYADILDFQAGVLQKHFSERELRELLAFYRSPVGQKAIRIMPEVMRDAMAWAQAIMQKRLGGMMERIGSPVKPCQDEAQEAE